MCIYFFHNIHASPPRDVPFQNVLEPRNVRRHIKATWQTIPDGGPKTSNTMILSLKMYLPLTNSVPRSHLLVLIPVNQGIFHKGSEGESTQISPLTKKAKQSRNSIKREDRRRGLGGLQGPMSGKTQPVLEVGGNGECGWRALALTIAAQNANRNVTATGSSLTKWTRCPRRWEHRWPATSSIPVQTRHMRAQTFVWKRKFHGVTYQNGRWDMILGLASGSVKPVILGHIHRAWQQESDIIDILMMRSSFMI